MVDKVESYRDRQYLLFPKEFLDETTRWIHSRNLARRFLYGRAADRADRVCRQQVLRQVFKNGRPNGFEVQVRLHEAMLQDGLGEVQGRLHEAMLQEGVVLSLSTLDEYSGVVNPF